ncbi:hypothetical protein MKS88_000966 [Plasmodium brasilianum]|uniref:Uncharacterized protein n=2 Tax=Plasmodium (Plasmodium) TaxID=418103 RepID=A0A1A8XB77_PLAMA|nr:conserved Plasmodium protein, unknown function [Plasmodium malariae]KAI4840731.1 hypothetical protein MKS88_000966 [Plasmodium brasilianum]SBT01102.1 conserved Plasmodium protein, unknown function [Plasmodium malariae]SBT86298.1 conserved Plasmodium protein, unknown function [Plasmodium malariae]
MVEIRLKTQNSSCEFNLDFNEVKLPNDLNILKDLEKEVENSIYYLKRSNEEIKKYDPEGKDNDLFLALNENKFALSRKEERLKLIKSKIQNLECTKDNSSDIKNSLLSSNPLKRLNEESDTSELYENEHDKDEKNSTSEKDNIQADHLNVNKVSNPNRHQNKDFPNDKDYNSVTVQCTGGEEVQGAKTVVEESGIYL